MPFLIKLLEPHKTPLNLIWFRLAISFANFVAQFLALQVATDRRDAAPFPSLCVLLKVLRSVCEVSAKCLRRICERSAKGLRKVCGGSAEGLRSVSLLCLIIRPEDQNHGITDSWRLKQKKKLLGDMTNDHRCTPLYNWFDVFGFKTFETFLIHYSDSTANASMWTSCGLHVKFTLWM